MSVGVDRPANYCPSDLPDSLRRVYFFLSSPMNEPQTKRVTAFVDGQNLFNAAKYAFGYRFPNYDPLNTASNTVTS